MPLPAAPGAAHPEASAPQPVPEAVRLSRALALGSLAALVVLGLAWELWLAPTGSGTLAVKVLPLVFALPGLMRHRMQTHRWLALLVWLYVLEGLTRATSESGLSSVLAVLEVVLALVLFAACSWHIRSRLAQPRTETGA